MIEARPVAVRKFTFVFFGQPDGGRARPPRPCNFGFSFANSQVGSFPILPPLLAEPGGIGFSGFMAGISRVNIVVKAANE